MALKDLRFYFSEIDLPFSYWTSATSTDELSGFSIPFQGETKWGKVTAGGQFQNLTFEVEYNF